MNPSEAHRTVALDIDGMTCASCAGRIERKLNKLDGVTASVNYATERALVSFPASLAASDLVEVVAQAGYTAHLPAPTGDPTAADEPAASDPGDPTRPLRDRVVVCAVLSAPVIAWAMVPALQIDGWQWLSLTLAAPVVVWGGLPFHRAAWTNLRHGATTMDTLVSLGTLAAFGWSLYALVLGTAGMIGMTHGFSWTIERSDGAGNIYLETAAGVTTFLLAGRLAEARSKRRAGAALAALLDLGAKEVDVLDGDVERRLPVTALRPGDRFVVRPGETVAGDGVVETGTSALDLSMLTGESVPEEVSAGDHVIGGTLNVGGRLVIVATRVGGDTQLAQMARMVEDAQNGKTEVQRLADRVSAVFVPAVLVLAAATLAGWLLAGQGASAAFTAAVAVLIVACPCALGLATPTALMAGTGRGAQLGIVITGPEVLESTRAVDTVVLDKTGTLTTGRMSLVHVITDGGVTEEELLATAAAVEDGSEHAIGRAVVAAAQERGLHLEQASGFTALTGLGARADVAGRAVTVGRPALLAGEGLPLGARLERELETAHGLGTAVAVGWDGAARGLLVVADQVRDTASEAVSRLRSLGLEPVLLTGDHEVPAHRVAAALGIDEVVAGVLPAGKVDIVRGLQERGRVVAMIGDGVNDAPALAQADLGVAMGSGTDAAIAASDLTLAHGDLLTAADAIRLARRTLATIKGNLFWAFAYNVAALPLAAAGMLNPMLAGAAMALSSVFVVTNSLRLRGFRAGTRPGPAATA